MFSPLIPQKSLAVLCRNLQTLLSSGVPLLKALRTAGSNVRDPRVRKAMAAVELAVRKGEDLSAAFARTDAFPPLAIEMIHVGEETGELPEILRHLALHYENLHKMRRMFYAAIAWPAFQLIAAILIIGLMIAIIGALSKGTPIDVLGLGLTGTSGAITWLVLTFGTLGGLLLAYTLIVASASGKRVLDPLFLRIPVIGGCLRSFALARFSWALALTQQTGMGLDRCVDTSLRATSNGAYIAVSPQVTAMVMAGEEITDALRETRLFPETFLQTVEVADASGTLPESLERLSPHLEEDARRSLTMLVAVAGGLIWVMVAGFIIFLIFRLAFFYIGQWDEALKGI